MNEFLERVIASCLGAGLAIGSCNSCYIRYDDGTERGIVGGKIGEVQKEVKAMERRLAKKLEGFQSSVQTPTGTVYKIGGKEYLCVPAQEGK